MSAQRSVDILRQTISAQQQQWLKTQQQLVELCQDKECQAGQVEKLSRKFTIFSQRKIRIESELLLIILNRKHSYRLLQMKVEERERERRRVKERQTDRQKQRQREEEIDRETESKISA